jgi:hypothetical protein
MKIEIQDLAKQLEQGKIDKAGFDARVQSLIEDTAVEPEAEAAAGAAGEAHAVRSQEISFAARRARSL